MALLEIEDLRCSFATEDGVVKAVDGISLASSPAGMLGIVGESGSGKSVSMLTVMGLTRAENATISGSAASRAATCSRAPTRSSGRSAATTSR